MGKVIGIDLDGVIYDWHRIIYDYIVYHYKETYDYKAFWKAAREDDYKFNILDSLVKVSIFYDKVDINKHTLESLNRLSENNTLCYITSRPESSKISTERWMKRCNVPFRKNLVITQNKRPHVSLFGCDYFIDDKRETIDSLQSITNAILFKNGTHDEDYVKGYNYISNLNELLEVRL